MDLALGLDFDGFMLDYDAAMTWRDFEAIVTYSKAKISYLKTQRRVLRDQNKWLLKDELDFRREYKRAHRTMRTALISIEACLYLEEDKENERFDHNQLNSND